MNNYMKPELEVIEFEDEDIIRTSGEPGEVGGFGDLDASIDW